MKANSFSSDIRFNIEFTYIKIIAFLILVSGTWYSLANHEATVITLSIITAAGLLGFRKTQETAQKKVALEEKKVNVKMNLEVENEA